MQTEKVLISKKEAANLLSLSVRSVEYLIQFRELPSRRIGRRVLIPRQALEQFARRDHRTKPSKKQKQMTTALGEKEESNDYSER